MASKYVTLVQKLVKRQEEGRLDWKETESAGVFQVSFPEYGLRISARGAQGGTVDIVIAIYNTEGAVIDEFSDMTIKNDMENAYSVMGNLFAAARRSALGVETALNSILGALDDS